MSPPPRPSDDSASSASEEKPAKPDQQPEEKKPEEAPPLPPPEVKRPGSVPGPFKLNFDFARMHERIAARADRTRGMQLELNKDQLAMLDQPPVAMPKLVSKSVILVVHFSNLGALQNQ